MTETNQSKEAENQELREIMPFLKDWNQFYLIVLGELVLTIILLFAFSRFFA
ncbi:MAG: hypothetical protein AAF388_23185 [Bacteroidota bacterium]